MSRIWPTAPILPEKRLMRAFTTLAWFPKALWPQPKGALEKLSTPTPEFAQVFIA